MRVDCAYARTVCRRVSPELVLFSIYDSFILPGGKSLLQRRARVVLIHNTPQPGLSLLALLLTLCAMTAGDPAIAGEPLGDSGTGLHTCPPLSHSPYWLDDTTDPLLRRLPLPVEPSMEDQLSVDEAPPSVETTRARLGTALGQNDRAPVSVGLWWIPAQDLQDDPGELAMNGEDLELAFPLRVYPDGIWLALGNVRRLEIVTASRFPDSGLQLPSQLWDIEVGAMRLREFSSGWRAGGMLRVGSPSDQPFAALRDMTVTLLGFLTIPRGQRDAWSFSLFYSPTAQVIYPIPGIAYVWRPSDQFQANLGVPFSLDYRPTETLSVTASYRPLNQVQVMVRQSLGPSWDLYGGYWVTNQTYLLSERVDRHERTFIFDQRLVLGAQYALGRGWRLDFSSGYVFDRRIFQAERFAGDRTDELSIDPGVVGTLQLMWTR